jgi:ATP-dependent Clp protease ATP-binding subunit ClpA
MFERFTTQARRAIHLAMAEARAAGTHRIGCQHLLIGLAHGRSEPAADALSAVGLSASRLRELARRSGAEGPADPLDADALASLGIDLDQVTRAAEAAFGRGALDRPPGRAGRLGQRAGLTVHAKSALDIALQATRRTGDRSIAPGHLLVGLIDQGDNTALALIAAAGVDQAALRAETLRRMTAAA